MTTPFRRTTDCFGRFRRCAGARRRAGVRLRLRAGRAECDGTRQRLCRRRGHRRGREHRVVQPRGSRAAQFPAGRGRDQCDHPVGQVPECELAGGARCSRWAARAATPAARRSCRTCTDRWPSTTRSTSGSASTCPFGLKTEYDDGWLGRYQALKSEVKTININPALSWKVDRPVLARRRRKLSAFRGDAHQQRELLGRRWRRGTVRLAAAGQITPAQAAALSGATAGLDTFAKITGDDSAWGWNVGAMFSFNGDANNDPGAGRIGLAYRSKIKYNVIGSVNFTNPTPPT